MKNIYLLTFLLVISTQLFGQAGQSFEPEKSPYIQKMDSLFEDLDKSEIGTGILYDRVPSFANIEQFNKTNDTANFHLFRQAWSELHRASYNPNFVKLSKKLLALKKNDDYDRVNLGLINMEFNTLNKGEGEEGKAFEMQAGKLKAIEGKDLYKKENLIMLAPLKEKVWGQNITYQFDKEYWLQETGQKI